MKKIGIGLGVWLVLMFLILVIYFDVLDKKNDKKVVKVENKGHKFIKTVKQPKSIAVKVVEKTIDRKLDTVDLASTYVYADTAFGYARVLKYAFDTKPVTKPMYTASDNVIENGVLEIDNLKPKTKYYLKIWIDNDLYVDTTFVTKDRDYKERQKLERKIYQMKQWWIWLSYDSSTEYIYKNYLLAFAKKVEYKLTSEEWKLQSLKGSTSFTGYVEWRVKNEEWKIDGDWVVYSGESLGSGYMYLTWLAKNTTYHLKIRLNQTKLLQTTFKTTDIDLNKTVSVPIDILRVKNETGLVVQNEKLTLNFDYSGDIKEISKIVVRPYLWIKDTKKAESKFYTQDELKSCNELINKIYKIDKNTVAAAATIQDVKLFPYINTGDIRLLTWDLQQYKSLFEKCAGISKKIEKFRKTWYDEKNKELEKQVKTNKIGKLIKSYTLENLSWENYEIRISYKDKKGKEQEWDVFTKEK